MPRKKLDLLKFTQSTELQHLRSQRRRFDDVHERNILTLQIYRMYRSKIRGWKGVGLKVLLPLASHGRRVTYLPCRFSGTKAAQHPLPDEWHVCTDVCFLPWCDCNLGSKQLELPHTRCLEVLKFRSSRMPISTLHHTKLLHSVFSLFSYCGP